MRNDAIRMARDFNAGSLAEIEQAAFTRADVLKSVGNGHWRSFRALGSACRCIRLLGLDELESEK